MEFDLEDKTMYEENCEKTNPNCRGEIQERETALEDEPEVPLDVGPIEDLDPYYWEVG